MNTRQTASGLYDQHRHDIARVMDWIELELDRHQANAGTNSGGNSGVNSGGSSGGSSGGKNWGSVGELGHVRARLIETLAFLSSQQPQAIEGLLDEDR